jgi:ABC-type multidrug transport system ATPase subunit
MQLLGGRRLYGVFDGDINLIGNTTGKSLYGMTAYVSTDASRLYTPGLTYHEMLLYAARLRIGALSGEGPREAMVQNRVIEVLRAMNLWWCRDRLITERPTDRGALGGELRRLAIAIALVHLPPVILLEDPVDGLDAAVSMEVMSSLRHFADEGCTIVCSMAKPSLPLFNLAHDLVLLSRGHRIYAGPRNDIADFFCSDELGYSLQEDVDLADFVFDIADGTERPAGTRKALQSDDIMARFEQSRFHEPSAMLEDGAWNASMSLLPQDAMPYYGYFRRTRRGHLWSRTLTVIERAFYVKIREREVLVKSLKQSIVLGLLFGYFQLGMGKDIDYCMNILAFAYNDVATVSSHMWLICSAAFAGAAVNIHIVCQKIKVYRHENAVGACPTAAFWFATLVSEIPFSVFFSVIQASLIYSMAALNTGINNYFFYVSAICMVGVIGLTTAIGFAAVIKKELIVRDLFVFCSFMMTMSSGYLFKYDDMNSYVSQVSKVNFMRWAYESLLVWKFGPYPDGEAFLATYDFDHFDHHRLWFLMMYFVLADIFIFFLGLLPAPNLLRRKKKDEATEALLRGDDDDDTRRSSSVDMHERSSSSELHFSERDLEPAVPKVFTKQSSVSSASSYRVSTNVDGKQKGPTVTFKKLSMSVPDKTSPEGMKKVLHEMSGQFDWGRLTLIMGTEGAGKSSLLSILGGELRNTSSASVRGVVQYDGKPIDFSVAGWRRCGFVEATDLHYRDITVQEVIYYAMMLRCNSRRALAMVDENIKQALELVQLVE